LCPDRTLPGSRTSSRTGSVGSHFVLSFKGQPTLGSWKSLIRLVVAFEGQEALPRQRKKSKEERKKLVFLCLISDLSLSSRPWRANQAFEFSSGFFV